jgi:hypothetical protein
MEFVEVEDIEDFYYKGKVYDLTIPVDHSYKINGYTVHNSFCGSLTAYSLGISTIDPIRFGLMFERFLNEQRVQDSVFNFFGEE